VRIFAWSADPGTRYWRLTLPLGELARQGHDVQISDIMPPHVQHEAGADVLVASRTATRGASDTFQRLCREGRMLCVYETDDDTLAITPDNTQAFKVFSDPKIRDCITANLACAHLVTTTNEHLAERLRQHTSAPIAILPNRVPRWLTDLPASWESAPAATVDYCHTGGPSHVVDFGEMERPLRMFLRDNPTARFVSFGTDNSHRVSDIRRGRVGRPGRHVRWQGGVEDYLGSLVGTDVGLAPLRATLFNASKTPLKAMEFGALGAPVVASRVAPYDGYVRDGDTGFLCATPKDWRQALDALMDPDVRRAMGSANRLQACANLVEDHAYRWLKAYQQVMAGTVAA
jgi:hypothetical protein